MPLSDNSFKWCVRRLTDFKENGGFVLIAYRGISSGICNILNISLLSGEFKWVCTVSAFIIPILGISFKSNNTDSVKGG